MWHVQSFHNYADYALGDEFAAAFDKLVHLGRDLRLALMCSEAVWWRCHRRIIADYLLLNGHPVDHLMAPGQIDHAMPTPGARRTAQGKVDLSRHHIVPHGKANCVWRTPSHLARHVVHAPRSRSTSAGTVSVAGP